MRRLLFTALTLADVCGVHRADGRSAASSRADGHGWTTAPTFTRPGHRASVGDPDPSPPSSLPPGHGTYVCILHPEWAAPPPPPRPTNRFGWDRHCTRRRPCRAQTTAVGVWMPPSFSASLHSLGRFWIPHSDGRIPYATRPQHQPANSRVEPSRPCVGARHCRPPMRPTALEKRPADGQGSHVDGSLSLGGGHYSARAPTHSRV